MAVTPNPVANGLASIRYTLSGTSTASLEVFDPAGRRVARLQLRASRTGTATLDMRRLSSGVYLVRLECGGDATTRKLVLQH
jgi:hypothetical protein